MSDSPSTGEALKDETPDAPNGKPPCAELKKAMEKCMKEKGEDSCKELLESYHKCLHALGIKT